MERSIYDRMFAQEDTHWWFSARRDILCRVIEQFARPSGEGRVLEAGCGTGGNLAMLSSFGELDAFEFDEEARQKASGRIEREVLFGALPDQIPYESTTYALIGLFDVLEHIENDVATLAGLGQRLDSDGRLVVTVPAIPWMWSKHDERHHHFRRYTRRTLHETAERAGLVVERVFYFNVLLLPVAMGLRALKALLRRDSPDDLMPNPWINRALYAVFSSEKYVVGRMAPPIGLSVCAVLKRASAVN